MGLYFKFNKIHFYTEIVITFAAAYPTQLGGAAPRGKAKNLQHGIFGPNESLRLKKDFLL
jgi:hypothetical protein